MAMDGSGPLRNLAGSLASLRVLDASRVLAGPYAGQILADLGAEVIKIEQPGSGDETRGWGPPFAGELSAYFLACNRGKRSLTLDLKSARGRELLHGLAQRSDVLIENMRANSLPALGLDAPTLHRINPRLIICSLSGFGRGGRHDSLPGYDFVVQGMSGMMAATGPVDGPPSKVGVAMADIATGLHAVIAILAALRARERDGHGLAIELALVDCAVAAMANVAQSYLVTGVEPPRRGNAHGQIVPYEAFPTADSWLVLAVGNDGQWRRFCAAAGHPEFGYDPRFASNADRVRGREALLPVIAAWLKSRDTAAWQQDLAAAGVPCGPIWDFQTLFSSELASERHFRIRATRPDGSAVDLLRSPLLPEQRIAAMPPPLGANSAAVLREILGLSDEAINALARDGVI